MAITVDGELAAGVTAKDLVLHLIGVIRVRRHRASSSTAGSDPRAVDGRPHDRVQHVHRGRRACGMVAPDDTTFDYLRGRPRAPKGADWDRAVAAMARTLVSDDGAVFDREVRIDARDIRPTITWGTHPGQVVRSRRRARPDGRQRGCRQRAPLHGLGGRRQPVAGRAIDVVFVGSCTNSRGCPTCAGGGGAGGRRWHPGVRLLVVPGSAAVKREAEGRGIDHVVRAPAANGASRAARCASR